MAFGTPTDGGAAYSVQNGTTVSPAYPASIAAGDCLVLIIGMKPSTANSGSVTTPSGWTLRETITGQGGYGTTLQADQGNTNLWMYSKDVVAGTETGNLSVTVATNNICWGLIIRIPSGLGDFFYGSADGTRDTAPTSGVAFTNALTNGTTATNYREGDMAIWAMCIPTDALNNGFTLPTISASGATFDTPQKLEEPDSGVGNDIGGYVAYASCTAGSSTAAPTIGATATGTVTNVRGPLIALRIREAAIFADPGSYSITGSAATLLENRFLNLEAGSYSITGSAAELTRNLRLFADPGSYSITGADATLLDNRFLNLETGSYSITGEPATFIKTSNNLVLDADPGTYSITGSAAELLQGYAILADPGSYAITGSAANLLKSVLISADPGTYAINGSSAELLKGSIISADAGSYSISGSNAELLVSSFLSADAGSYVISGFNATLLKDSELAADAGSYDITGINATLIVATPNRVLVSDPGSYSLTGSNASLFRDIPFNAEAGSYAITGSAAELLLEFTLIADAGDYAITGFNAELLKSKTLFADAGSYSLTGFSADLLKGYLLNAEGATEYVEPGYVDPGYVIQSGYYVDGFPVSFIYPVFPLPNQVLAGVVYGPNGNDYVGTYVCPPAQNKQILYIFDD